MVRSSVGGIPVRPLVRTFWLPVCHKQKSDDKQARRPRIIRERRERELSPFKTPSDHEGCAENPVISVQNLNRLRGTVRGMEDEQQTEEDENHRQHRRPRYIGDDRRGAENLRDTNRRGEKGPSHVGPLLGVVNVDLRSERKVGDAVMEEEYPERKQRPGKNGQAGPD